MYAKELNPSPELKANEQIYNTFAYKGNKEAVFAYLSEVYEKNANSPNLSLIDRIKKLATLSDELLLFLFVEIKKMNLEGDCFAFEKREPGCIKAFFTALSKSLEGLIDEKEPTFPQNIDKELHRISTDIKKVTMEQIEEKTSGNYRSGQMVETLSLPPEYISLAGIKYLIDLIGSPTKHGRLHTMLIGSKKDYKKMRKLTSEYESMEIMYSILEALDELDSETPEATLNSVNDYLTNRIDGYSEHTEKQLLHYLKINYSDFPLKGFKHTFTSYLISHLEKVTSTDENILRWIDCLKKPIPLDELCAILKEIKSKYSVVIRNVETHLKVSYNLKLDQACALQTQLIAWQSMDMSLEKYNASNLDELALALYKKLQNPEEIFIFRFSESELVEELIEFLKQDLNANIGTVKNKSVDEKLAFIYHYVQLALLIHPYCDANNRTYVNELAPRLHLQLGLDIGVWFNPFVFYAHSLPEIVETAKLSIANYLIMLEAISTGNNPHFNFENNLNSEQKEQIKDMVQPLRQCIEKMLLKDQIRYIKNQLKSYTPERREPDYNFFPSAQEVKLAPELAVIEGFSTREDLYQYVQGQAQQGTPFSDFYKGLLETLPHTEEMQQKSVFALG